MALTDWQTAQIKVISEPYLKAWREEMINPKGIIHAIDVRIEKESLIVYQMVAGFPAGSSDVYIPIAKATYRKSTDDWKLFWQKRDLKWHGYEIDMIHKNIESIFKVIDEDSCCCFWG